MKRSTVNLAHATTVGGLSYFLILQITLIFRIFKKFPPLIPPPCRSTPPRRKLKTDQGLGSQVNNPVPIKITLKKRNYMFPLKNSSN